MTIPLQPQSVPGWERCERVGFVFVYFVFEFVFALYFVSLCWFLCCLLGVCDSSMLLCLVVCDISFCLSHLSHTFVRWVQTMLGYWRSDTASSYRHSQIPHICFTTLLACSAFIREGIHMFRRHIAYIAACVRRVRDIWEHNPCNICKYHSCLIYIVLKGQVQFLGKRPHPHTRPHLLRSVVDLRSSSPLTHTPVSRIMFNQ